MKEKIYTIPVMDAFKEDCECPLCVLEKKLEDEYTAYFLGPSLMEPDCRLVTNDKGFCRHHLGLLYNSRENRLGLGLTIETHMAEQNKRLRELYDPKAAAVTREAGMSSFSNFTGKLTSRQTDTLKLIDELADFLGKLEKNCAICSKLEYTMDRYTEVIFHLWKTESEFKDLFLTKKGFCLGHLRLLLSNTGKYLGPGEAAAFVGQLMKLEIDNLERIRKEVEWFNKKFDYRYSDAPWGNSKDALPRSIQKLAGYCDLK